MRVAVNGSVARWHGDVKGSGTPVSDAMNALKPVLLCLAAVAAFAAAGLVQVVTAPSAPAAPLVQVASR